MSPPADVLIVTATAVESRAVLAAFAQRSGQPARPVALGDRIYHDLGGIDGRRAFLALCEMGTAGVGASLQSVQKAIAALSPAAVILVGIAFGVDERKQQIGDLLVARQLFLYEPQRVGADQVVVRGDRPHASARLIDALRNAELSWPQDSAPVRFGLLLSGEKLVDNSDYRHLLLQHSPDIIGGEMEGGGLYVACADAKVDWIVVKAICDFADGNKAVDKDARQAIAAHNAAAFVAHAVSFISGVGTGVSTGWPGASFGPSEPADSETFDCFLSHNSRDKPAVRVLAAQLHARGISVWLDEQRLRPSLPWQSLLESGIRASRSIAVLVGADGLGPWQEEKMRAALSLAVRDRRSVIPVVLADAQAVPELPLFLQGRGWVDLRVQNDPGGPSALDLLVWGITGKHPDRTAPGPTSEVVNPDRAQGPDGGDQHRGGASPPKRSERQRLQECIDKAFASEDELRTFCADHFEPFSRNLRELDRRSYITRELIGYVSARGETAVLWQFLQARNPECARTYRETGQ